MGRSTEHVEGLSDVDAALGALKPTTAKGVLRRAGKEALGPFDRDWREGVHRRTGQLEASGGIGSKVTKSVRQANERENFVEVFAGPGTNPQAVQGEFGNEHQQPNPAVRASWDKNSPAIPGAVGKIIWAEIEKTAQRLAKKAARAAAKG